MQNAQGVADVLMEMLGALNPQNREVLTPFSSVGICLVVGLVEKFIHEMFFFAVFLKHRIKLDIPHGQNYIFWGGHYAFSDLY